MTPRNARRGPAAAPEESEWQTIRASTKVVSHLGTRLYRTPAGAIKELISNAWDADARHVSLHTGFPAFTSFSCVDNGAGMPKRTFRHLVDRGIGWSEKRADGGHTAQLGRPVIGRLGIGLLALAQVCDRFSVTSWHADEPFSAEIRFPGRPKEAADGLVWEADSTEERFVAAGQYRFHEAPTQEGAGLLIFSQHIRATYHEHMSDLSIHQKWIDGRPASYESLEELLDVVYLQKGLTDLSEYEKLLFQLALYPPLPYFGSKSTSLLHQVGAVRRHDTRLRRWRFAVEVDGVALQRPLRVPAADPKPSGRRYGLCDCGPPAEALPRTLEVGPPGEPGAVLTVRETEFPIHGFGRHLRVFEFDHRGKVAGRELEFYCYLYSQISRLYPRDIQGVLIRIRDVAVGAYDSTFMEFPKEQGPRFSQVTGEVWVQQGLEDALNIDRESFDKLDPHYRRLRACLHGVLGHILPRMWDEGKQANRRAREERAGRTRQHVLETLHAGAGPPPRDVEFTESADTRVVEPLAHDGERHVLLLDRRDPDVAALARATPKRNRDLAKLIAFAFEAAQREPTRAGRRHEFYRALAEIMRTHGGKEPGS